MKKISIVILSIVVIVIIVLSLNKDVPANEKQMYGYNNYEEYVANRTDEIRILDDEFLSSISEIINNKSVEGVTNIIEATQYACDQGLSYYQKGNKSMAMKRYNQAWLIDQTHPCPYEGFALLK